MSENSLNISLTSMRLGDGQVVNEENQGETLAFTKLEN
jgi:hypothetical protein